MMQIFQKYLFNSSSFSWCLEVIDCLARVISFSVYKCIFFFSVINLKPERSHLPRLVVMSKFSREFVGVIVLRTWDLQLLWSEMFING